MDNAGFIIASYVVTFGSVAAYAIGVLRRSKRASREIPPEQRPWQ